MAPPTAAGCISIYLDSFKTMLSGVTAMQTFLGVANAASALPRIYCNDISQVPDTDKGTHSRLMLEQLRPLAIIYVERGTARLTKIAGPSTAVFQGDISLVLERDIPGDYLLDAEAACRDMENHVGQIAADVLAAANVSGKPALTDVIFDEPCLMPSHEQIPEIGNVQVAILTFSKGGGQ